MRLNRLLVSSASRGMRNICNIGIFIFSFEDLAQPRARALARSKIGSMLQKIAENARRARYQVMLRTVFADFNLSAKMLISTGFCRSPCLMFEFY